VEWVEEPSYFFRLSAWQDRLLAFYEANPEFIQPEGRRNEVISFVKGGLHDLSVSRTTFGWGVPVPNAPEHVMYVWLDALTNYLTELGYPDTGSAPFTNFWRDGETIHVVGKDILRFHTVYWPAFLMSAGVPVVGRVFAHGWWTNEGQKISKSVGNVIKPVQLIETYGLDATRYFLLREVPFGNDGNFSSMAMVQRINSELSNTLGNLAQRTLALVQKYCAASVPSYAARIEAVDAPVEAAIYRLMDKVRPAMEGLKFHYALELVMELGRLLNEYIDSQAPWNLRKTDVPRMEAVLYLIMEGLRCLGICLQPFIPQAASLWLDQLGVAEDARSCAHASKAYALNHGASVPEPQPIFPRFEV
jgi:methionyl-tRNA synthetase